MKAISDFLHKYIGNPLEWSSAGKANLVLYIFLLEQLFYLVSLRQAMNLGEFSQFFDLAMVKALTQSAEILALVTIVLIGVVSYLKRFHPNSFLFEVLATQYFGLAHVFYGYCIGLMSLPVGVVLAGAPVTGFIIFNRRAVTLAAVTSLAGIVALSYATGAGLIPYAPVANNLALVTNDFDWFWSVVYCFYAFPHLLVLFSLAYYVLHRWRVREAEVKYLSSRDSLTGLMNRRTIMNHLSLEQEYSERTGRPLSVIMVDLDHFKQINDTWGHNVGDQVLREMSEVLSNTVRENDFVGRYGGEEFLVLLPGLDQETAKPLAERLRKAVSDRVMIQDTGVTFSVTASLGLSSYSKSRQLSSEELVKQADIALYQAKNQGRDQLIMI